MRERRPPAPLASSIPRWRTPRQRGGRVARAGQHGGSPTAMAIVGRRAIGGRISACEVRAAAVRVGCAPHGVAAPVKVSRRSLPDEKRRHPGA
eukprot:scaffold26323_cov101-Isochrysis_galbana.AAC.5